ncbi:MAG: Ldh family oxidoreductase [Acetobacteraceae bacterium]|nr:Ldh family oxidoreductase [Acetobacteraceae bacterium]MDW8398068.1 Ldh family oxidoreductase [Acetobacteraceae bacterium]
MRLTDPALLHRLTAALFAAEGVPEADSAWIAETLVAADLWGHPSHGVMRAPWYLARLRSGAMRRRTAPEWPVDAGAVALMDAKEGIGQVAAAEAMRSAIRRAKAHGVGVVSVRNSNHHGALGCYTRMAAAAGCIGMLATNASPAMPPWGGRAKLVGNNPWSVAAPAGRHPPFVLDLANTAVARGKIFDARQKGLPIPEGWALDPEGRPTTDPLAALSGVLLPMAGHKGYGIALAMEVLAGVLSGAGLLDEVAGPYQAERRSGCGHFVLALDISRFAAPEDFAARMEGWIARLKAAPLAAGAREILYPGEGEARAEARHRAEGIPLAEATRAALEAEASALGVALPEGW